MTKAAAEILREDLSAAFDAHGVFVAVGVWHKDGEWGVGIRSQCDEVDAKNIGTVTAL